MCCVDRLKPHLKADIRVSHGNVIPSVSGKGGFDSDYPSDFYVKLVFELDRPRISQLVQQDLDVLQVVSDVVMKIEKVDSDPLPPGVGGSRPEHRGGWASMVASPTPSEVQA